MADFDLRMLVTALGVISGVVAAYWGIKSSMLIKERNAACEEFIVHFENGDKFLAHEANGKMKALHLRQSELDGKQAVWAVGMIGCFLLASFL